MKQEQIKQLQKIASHNRCSHRIINNQDGITVIFKGRRGGHMTEVESKGLQESLRAEGFESCRKSTQDGWTVIV